jgi:hypothetical protein
MPLALLSRPHGATHDVKVGCPSGYLWSPELQANTVGSPLATFIVPMEDRQIQFGCDGIDPHRKNPRDLSIAGVPV